MDLKFDLCLVLSVVFFVPTNDCVAGAETLVELSTASSDDLLLNTQQASTTLDPVGRIRHLLPKVKEGEGSLNVSVQVGSTAYLPCRFLPEEGKEISDDQVSWFRRRDWHILTAGIHTYTNDARFTVLHPQKTFDWTLQIKYTTSRDNGTYECQLSTGTGVISQFVNLHVITPRAVILGNKDYHLQLSSKIHLTCVIEQMLTVPQYIYWYHNEQMINYNHHRGGISVSFEVRPKPRSHLSIEDATIEDSGNYSCTTLGAQTASVQVFVSLGDKIAAIQRRKSSAGILKIDFLVIFGPVFLAGRYLLSSEMLRRLLHCASKFVPR